MQTKSKHHTMAKRLAAILTAALLLYALRGSLNAQVTLAGSADASNDLTANRVKPAAIAISSNAPTPTSTPTETDWPAATHTPTPTETPNACNVGFDYDGIALGGLNSGSQDYGEALVIQPDGKIVVAGSSWISDNYDFGVMRFQGDGSIDPTFGSGGKAITSIGELSAEAQAAVVQPDGKIVVAGFSWISSTTHYDFALARYNPDGGLDLTFGDDGVVTTSMSEGSDFGYSLALQPDGKIVVAGSSQGNFALVRLNTNGSLDIAFDGDGQLTTDIGVNTNDVALAIAIQSDGRMIAAGRSDADVAVVRYNADGSLDTTFGSGGKVLTDFWGNDIASSIGLQHDGKVIVVGSTQGSSSDFVVARYHPDGSLDTSFDLDGKLVTSIGASSDSAQAVVIQSDGKIVAGGEAWRSGPDIDFALARYNENGSLDLSYSADGIVITDIGEQDRATALALQPDGKLVAAGRVWNGSDWDYGLARYLPDGSLDTGDCPAPTPTPSLTASPTSQSTPAGTTTETATRTSTAPGTTTGTPTSTLTSTPTSTPSVTSTATPTSTQTQTLTSTVTATTTATHTPTVTATRTPTWTRTPSATSTTTSTPTASATPPPPIATEPVRGYWQFENNLFDGSTSMNHGSGNSAYSSGILGQALMRSGSEAPIPLPHGGTGNSLIITDLLTIEAWVYSLNYGASYHHIIDNRSGYALSIVSGQPAFFSGSWWQPASAPVLTTGTWHYIVATFGGGTKNLYVDGQLVATEAAGPSVGAGSGDISIAGEGGGSGYKFAGLIDELRVSRQVLSASEIAANYSGGLGTPTATPTETLLPTESATPTHTPTPTGTFTLTSTPTASPTSTPDTDLIFADGFESGNLTAWTAAQTDSGDLAVNAAAALIGNYGLRGKVDSNGAIYVQDDTPSGEKRYRARFYFDPHGIAMTNGNNHPIFAGYTGAGAAVVRIEFRRSSGNYQLRSGIRNDGSGWTNSAWVNIADAPHFIELEWKASTSAGTQNGYLTLWIDGVQRANLTGIDNDMRQIDRVRMGALNGVESGTRGVYFFDEFVSKRTSYIGPVPDPTPTPTVTSTGTPTQTQTESPTSTPTATPTRTMTVTTTLTATFTVTPTRTPTVTRTITDTTTPTATVTPSATEMATSTSTAIGGGG